MNDSIDRQAAIDAMSESLKRVFPEHRQIAEKCLNALPSAQTQRMKGRWISRDGREDCYECSECHAVIENDEVYWRNNYFCYHCGADMRGERHEAD